MSEPEQSPHENRVFLSYSRTEMYYAEAITIRLQELGFDMWFDLQQLEPGCVWEDEIEHGLNESNELVLIVSRTALASRWVATEWQHALAQGHQIHLVIFEEVNTKGYSYTDKEGNLAPIDTQKLFDNATSIIDGRADFHRTTNRLVRAIQGDETPKDAIPKPNRFYIPKRLPIMMSFVTLTMLLLTLFWIWLTIISLATFPPIAFTTGIIAVLTAFEFRHFIVRQSFRGTRMTLFIMMFVTLVASSSSFLLFLGAWLASIFSLNVNRWSPRGEGLRRGETSNRAVLLRSLKNMPHFFRWYAHLSNLRKSIFTIFISILSFSISAIFSQDENIPLIVFFTTVLALIVLTLIAGAYKRLKRNEIPPSDKTFRIVHNTADSNIANTISQKMDGAGHTRIITRDDPTDYNIVVATNFLQPEDFISYLGQTGRWIVLVASNFEDKGWFSELRNFQWVDFRKHDEEHLETMVDELRESQYDIVSHSFSTRTTPQSFSQKIILPRYVQSFVFWILVVINTSLALGTSVAVTFLLPSDTTSDAETTLAGTLFMLIFVFVLMFLPNLFAISAVVKVMLRQTTEHWVARTITVYLAFFAVIFSMNPAAIILVLIAYFPIRWVVHVWLRQWIPIIEKEKRKSIPQMTRRRYLALYMRSLAIAIVISILVITLMHADDNLTIVVNQALFRF